MPAKKWSTDLVLVFCAPVGSSTNLQGIRTDDSFGELVTSHCPSYQVGAHLRRLRKVRLRAVYPQLDLEDGEMKGKHTILKHLI